MKMAPSRRRCSRAVRSSRPGSGAAARASGVPVMAPSPPPTDTDGVTSCTSRRVRAMGNKAAISLTTGLEDPEKVTVALLMAVAAAEGGRPTLTFLSKEAVRLAIQGVAVGVGCDGCPSIADVLKRYQAAGGRFLVCPLCFDAKRLDRAALIEGAEVGGTVPFWEWIGDEGATT